MTRILIADDNAASRELIRTVLEHEGYEMFEAVDGLEALELARRVQPDLIILDLQMPRLDGFGTMAKLRSESLFDGTPVVALTASAMAGDKDRALASGFTGYLTKPIGLGLLRSEVQRLLHGAIR